MNILRCENGHFYDGDKYGHCPHCKAPTIMYDIPEKYKRMGKSEFVCEGSSCSVFKINSEPPLALRILECGRDEGKLNRATHEKRIMDAVSGCFRAVTLVDYDVVSNSDDTKTVYFLEKYYPSLEARFSSDFYSIADAVKAVIGICNAAEEILECGVIHLDLKPANAFTDAFETVRLGDFGCSLFISELPEYKEMRGTPEYLAPEVYQEHKCSELSEVYSIGLILYYLLNDRRLPFVNKRNNKYDAELAVYKRLAGKELPALHFGIPKEAEEKINSVIRRACAYKTENRIKSIKELRVCLEKLYGDDGALNKVVQRNCGPFLQCSVSDTFQPEKPFCDGDTWNADTVAKTVGTFNINNTHKEEAPIKSFEPPAAPPSQNAGIRGPHRIEFSAYEHGNSEKCDGALSGSAFPVGSAYSESSRTDEPAVSISEVEFSAVAPKRMVKGEYSIIDIVMYEEESRHIVDQIISQSDTETQEKITGKMKVGVGANIRIVLESPDISIAENEMSGIWQHSHLNFSFPVYLPEDYNKRQILFFAKVYIDGIIATRLTFAARCSSLFEHKISIKRDDVLTAFISYASQDRKRVATIVQGMKKVRPEIDLFFDVESLRSGENWEKILYGEIEKRDVLYLCWSHFAKESEWVDKEWRYAYAQKGADGIEPMPIEMPDVCPPPEELKEKHWNDKLLYLIDYMK